jgi:hypothetical protein
MANAICRRTSEYQLCQVQADKEEKEMTAEVVVVKEEIAEAVAVVVEIAEAVVVVVETAVVAAAAEIAAEEDKFRNFEFKNSNFEKIVN